MRQVVDLGGLWRFHVDAYEQGEKLGYPADTCDVRLWGEVAVPCAFDDCGPGMAAYEGVGWFRRVFELKDEHPARSLALRFEGVKYSARVCPQLSDLPPASFPEGFRIRAFQPGDEGLWTDIHRDSEPYFEISDTLFDEQFGSDPQARRWRCYFVVDTHDRGVGTISAWYNRDYKGQEWGRVHWVAVRRSYQGRRLGRVMLAYALQRLAEWHERAYLDTSTARVAAIRLYLNAGFIPDLEPPGAVRAWTDFARRVHHPALAGLREANG
jgi:GNAT superfamily N-acetyltransferase